MVVTLLTTPHISPGHRLQRIAILSTSPLRTERTDVPLDEIVDVIAIGRGIGLWGDMVITLRNDEKIELRDECEND